MHDGFGVRRPLRFLAHKLELSDPQIEALARVISDLKLERAQSAVDDQRTLAAFADAVASSSFDSARASEGNTQRLASQERVGTAVVHALSELHALLTEDQRKQLAYMIRTGLVTL